MERSRDELAVRLKDLMHRMFKDIRSARQEEIEELDLTISQLRTLLYLSQGDRRMTEIAGYLGNSLPSATSLIGRMVGKHLVERIDDPSDRRIVSCRLTAEGQKVVNLIWNRGSEHIDYLADTLKPAELEIVVRAMEILLKALERMNGEFPTAKASPSTN